MPGILASIDVEDLGTAKVVELRDALSDLLTMKERFVSGGGLGMGSATDALGSVTTATHEAAAGYQRLMESQQATSASSAAVAQAIMASNQGLSASFNNLLMQVNDNVIAVQDANERIRLLAGGMALLVSALEAGRLATQAEAEALRALSVAAQEGTTFTTEQAQAIQALNEKIEASIPLTEADVAAVRNLAEQYGLTHAQTLGLASAMDQLIAQHQRSEAEIRKHASAFQALVSQLEAGQQATNLQKQALTDLADSIQTNQRFTDEHKTALQDLATVLRENGTLTAEQQAQLESLNQVYQESIAQTTNLVSALDQLLSLHQQSEAEVRKHAMGFQLLASQLQAGQQATDLQKQALTELANAIQINDTFTQDHKNSLMELATALRDNGTLTDEQKVKLDELNRAHLESVGALQDHTTGLQAFSAQAAVVAASLGLIAAGAYALLRESGDLAARLETLGVVMDITAKNAKMSGIEMRVQAAAIEKLGITSKEAADSVIQFATANLNLADASKLARVAQDLAVIAGENSSATYARLIAAIQTQRVMLLRNVGITTTMTQVTEKYAATLGKTARELGTMEKQQAMLNFILEEGEKRAGAYEASMGTAAKQIQSFTRLVEESKVMLGEALVPTMGVVIGLLSTMLKAWMALPAPIQAFATYILVAAAAMSAFSAALAGAQFLGIAAMFTKLGTSIAAFTAGVVAKKGIVVAATAAFGPWGAAIAAVTALVGLGTAAWVAYNNATRDNTLELQENLAKAIQQEESLTKLASEGKRVADAFADMERRGITPSAAAQEEYRQIAEKLLKVAPEMVRVIDAQGRSYEILTGWIDKATEAQGRKTQAELDAMQKQAFILRAQKQAIERQIKEAEDLAGKMARGEADRFTIVNLKESTIQIDHLDKLKEKLAGLREELKTVGPAADNAMAALKDGFIASGDAATKQRHQTKLAKELVKEYEKDLLDAGNAAITFAAKLRVAGVSQADLNKAYADPNAVAKVKGILNEIDQKWSEHTEKIAKKAKQTADEIEKLRERMVGDPSDVTVFTALQGMLDKTALSADEYRRRLFEAKDVLEKFGKSTFDQLPALAALRQNLADLSTLKFVSVTPEQVRAFETLNTQLTLTEGNAEQYHRALREGAKTLADYNNLTEEQRVVLDRLSPGLAKLAEGYRELMEMQKVSMRRDESKQLAEMERAMTEASLQMARERTDAQREHEYNWAREREQLYRENFRKIEDIERGMYERQEVSRMTAVKQAVYQEQQRLKAVHQSLQDEIRARNEALDHEEREIRLRYEMRVREVNDLWRLAMERRKIREMDLLEELAVRQRLNDTEGIANVQARLDVHREYTAQYVRLVNEQTNASLKHTEDTYHREMESLGQRRVAFEAFNQDARTAMARTADESAVMVKRIQIEYSQLYQFGMSVWQGITQTAISGFSKILQGAQSFKDVFLNIWQSIKSSLFGLFESILQEWVRKQGQMAAASVTQKGLGGIMQALGGFFGGGASAAPVIGANVGIPAIPGAAGGGAAGAGGVGVLAGGALAAGAGGYVGYQVGGMFDSRAGGALGGAASGAATGAIIGSVVPVLGTLAGAVIGGIAGLIGGVLGGGKNARMVDKAREEYIKAKGGIDELKKAAEAAGVSVDRLMDTKKPKEFAAEIRKIENGIAVTNMQRSLMTLHGGLENLQKQAARAGISLKDALAPGKSAEETAKAIELVNAKLSLISGAGGLEKLRRQAELVGYDIQRAFDATTIDEFNTRMEELNALLAEQQRRLEGLGTAASGLKLMLDGFEGTLGSAMNDAFGDKMEEFGTRLKEARDQGFSGSVVDFARSNPAGMFSPEDIEKVEQVTAKLQKEFNTLGLVASSVFARVVRETGNWMEAMAAVGPELDRMIQLQHDWGFAAEETLGPILALRQVMQDNQDVINSLSGVVMVLEGMAAAGGMNIDLFNALGSTAVANYDRLIERGVDANQAMLLMQPSLQALWEAQQRFHFETDEATQALIDQGIEQGIIGEHQRDINERILGVLQLIAVALGAELPEAWNAAAKAAEDAADRQEGGLRNVIDRTKEARDAYHEMGQAAIEAGRNAEDAATGAAEGHSPTGLKQVVFRLHESMALYREWASIAEAAGRRVEQQMGEVLVPKAGAERPTADGATPVHITVNNEVHVDPSFKSWDGADVERTWNDELRPKMLRDLDDNVGQIAAKIERRIGKYRR